MGDEPAEEREVRRHPLDDRLVERLREPVEGLRSVGAVGDQLRDHRVVAPTDLVSLLDARVDADPRGQAQAAHRPRLGQERARILGVEPGLDRVPLRCDLQAGERLAVGDPELELDEVEPRHGLGHRMLDLDPPVQLEEVGLVALHQELRRPGALVADRAAEGHGVRGEALTHARAETGRRGLLDDLLVAALHGAVALAECEDGAVAVSEQLHLDVPGVGEVALAVDRAVAERRLGLARGGLERLLELLGSLDDAHAAPAAPRGCLHEQREAELVRLTGLERRNARCGRDPLRLELVSAPAERLGRRADPGEPGVEHGLGEGGALREEPVAGVNELCAALAGGGDQRLRVEVRDNRHRGVGDTRVERALVSRADHRDRADPEPPARREDAHRDLATVRDQERPSVAHRRTTLVDRHAATAARRGDRPAIRPYAKRTTSRVASARAPPLRECRRPGERQLGYVPVASARSTAPVRSPRARTSWLRRARSRTRARRTAPAPSTSSGPSPPTARAAVAAAMPERHQASRVRSAASRVRCVTSATSASVIAPGSRQLSPSQ